MSAGSDVPLDARCTADQEGRDGASTRDTQAAEEGESDAPMAGAIQNRATSACRRLLTDP
jgi:hypothetical protein